VLLLVVAGCGSSSDSGTPGGSGIRGTTVVDVGCPVLTTATQCPTRPLAARLKITRPGATEIVAETHSTTDGVFTIELDPGRYEIVPENLTGTPYPRAEPLILDVVKGQVAVVTIQFDSGVR
jgi:hypothetical protein